MICRRTLAATMRDASLLLKVMTTLRDSPREADYRSLLQAMYKALYQQRHGASLIPPKKMWRESHLLQEEMLKYFAKHLKDETTYASIEQCAFDVFDDLYLDLRAFTQ